MSNCYNGIVWVVTDDRDRGKGSHLLLEGAILTLLTCISSVGYLCNVFMQKKR